MREIMTPQQVADYLQIDTDTVYRLIRNRRLAASRIGRAYRIPEADLEDFLVAQSTRPEVREALFHRVAGIAARNRGLDGDRVLSELDQQGGRARR